MGEGFVEEGWIGRTIAIGERVKAHVVKACSRCVMTTLAQDGLDRDRSILRTIARQNSNNLGIRVDVTDGGRVREGDEVRLLD